MNDLFDSHCRNCKHCPMGSFCNKYKMNPALSLEQCFEEDFKEYESIENTEE